MSLDVTRTRVAVTGGSGFLGTAVVNDLRREGCRDIAVPRSSTHDLRTEEGVRRFYSDFKPEVVVHLAATVGGIGANLRRPAQHFYDNAVMGTQLIEHGRLAGLRKFVCIGSVCSYPNRATVPFREDDLWNGFPEPTNAAYGLAKRMLLAQTQAYRLQYNFNAIYLILANLYGPNDDFSMERSHAIAAIIRKMTEARLRGEDQVVLWGDGSPTRDFLYVDDAARGILQATMHYDQPQPINLGSGREITIRELAQHIAALTEFRGEIVWDAGRPNGQQRRCVDVTLATKLLNFSARTPIAEGLEKTCKWYVHNRESIVRTESLVS